MTPKERVQRAVERRKPDRPPLTPLHAQAEVWKKLYARFGITGWEADPLFHIPGPKYEGLSPEAHERFNLAIGADFRKIEPPFIGPPQKTFPDGSWEGIWGERYEYVSFGSGSNVEPSYRPFAGVNEVAELSGYRFPSPDWHDYSEEPRQVQFHEGFALYAGDPGHGDFINGIGFLRGVEQVLLDIGLEEPVYLWLLEQKFSFTFEKLRRTLEAAGGRIDVVHLGEDLGTQLGPLISLPAFDRLFAQKYAGLFSLAHDHGAKAMLHCCGSIKRFIPRLLAIGLDILDVVQVDAAEMELESLREAFADRICFAGTLPVQTLLRDANPDVLRKEVQMRRELFRDGGLMIGPTNVMQVDMPTENFAAMLEEIGCLSRSLS
jgi:uroporphyrinogen decarboxylase